MATDRLGGAVVSTIVLAAVLCLSMAAQVAQPDTPRGSWVQATAALACLMSRSSAHSVLQDLGLKIGDSARVRWFVGSVAGFNPTPDDYTIMVESSDGQRAWLMVAFPYHHKWAAGAHYFLRRHLGRWEVEEGDGGMYDYQNMTKFANWLVAHRPSRIAKLVACSGRCAPPPWT